MTPVRMISFEQTSVIRKFTILFLIVSVIPLAVLFYLYNDLTQNGQIALTTSALDTVIIWVIVGIGCGYWAMRKMISGFIAATKAGQRTISRILDPNASTQSTGETNEIAILARTFNEITARLEEDRKNLELAKKTLHSVLTKISGGLVSANNIDGFLQLMVETATEALMGKVGMVLLLNKETNMLQAKTVGGVPTADFKKLELKANTGLFATVISSKNALIIPKISNLGEDAQYSGSFESPIICAPLLTHDQVLGVLVVCGKKTAGNFQEDDLNLLYNVALQTAVVLDNEELKYLASIDPLTNIFNFRHLTETLDYEVNRLRRYPGNLCVLMMDVDDFKAYNDQLGHIEGDILLQQLTKAVRSQLRATDIMCRYGGDEFAIILPQTEIEGARRAAEKIKTVIENLELKKKITVSIGGAQWFRNMTRQDLIAKADNVLYQAKNQGKNKTLFIKDQSFPQQPT